MACGSRCLPDAVFWKGASELRMAHAGAFVLDHKLVCIGCKASDIRDGIG
jgi:hypothetical protein